jgi:hypothetical protein
MRSLTSFVTATFEVKGMLYSITLQFRLLSNSDSLLASSSMSDRYYISVMDTLFTTVW